MWDTIVEHKEEIGTVMGAFVLYIVAEVTKWIKSRKGKLEVKDNVAEILLAQKSFHAKFDDEISTIKEDITSVKKELTYNGGSSLKDQINEMKGLQEARFFWQQNIQEEALFNCDKMGDCTFSNKALCELFGMHYTEMSGKGWLKAIGETQHEREDAYNAWISSIRNQLPYEYQYTVVNQKTGAKIKCIAKAEAMRNKSGEVMYYIGTVNKML